MYGCMKVADCYLFIHRNGERVLMNKSADYLVRCLPVNREAANMYEGAISSLKLE